MTSREELLALAAQLDAEGASHHVQFQDDKVPEAASEAGLRRKRAVELVKANEACRLLGLLTSSTPTSSTAAATPPWPRSELPVLPPPKSLKRTAPTPKVTRALRNVVVARLAGEHALLLAAASTSSAASAPSTSSASDLAALLVETVRGSPSVRRAATALALKQEESAVFSSSTGKETYLARARATTALGARTSAAEVQAALQAAKKRRQGDGDDSGDDEEGGGDGEIKKKKKKKRNAAPCPNPTPLPLLRQEQKEKEKEKEEAERQAQQQPLPLEEEEIDWEAAGAAAAAAGAAGERKDTRPQAAPPLSPRSAISAVVSAALAPFVEDKRASKEAAEAAAERAISKVLGSFLVSPLAAKAEEEGTTSAAVAAFLTDSQRGKISEFARKCLDAEERRRK